MIEIIGVRFKDVGKTYYFSPEGMKFEPKEQVLVETARGIELGFISLANRMVSEEDITPPLKPIVRRATPEDLQKSEENKKKERDAFDLCVKKIEEHKLEMALVDAEYTFDRSKLIFFFTADGRIDFRDLVRDLASQFHTRIELRQIGVRDEAKIVGGIGVCGCPLCCNTFLEEFHSVSIKMAKEQNLSLSPTKISGTCGRLMCCLKYEQEAYEDLLATTPLPGSIVDTPEGRGKVVDTQLLRGNLKVRLDDLPEAVPRCYHKGKCKLIKKPTESIDDTPRKSKHRAAEKE